MEHQMSESLEFEMRRNLEKRIDQQEDEIERSIRGIYIILENIDRGIEKLQKAVNGR